MLTDDGLKPIWWNAAYSTAFPKEVPALRNGDHLGQVIDLSSANACSEVSSSLEKELETATQVVELLKEAESTSIFGETVDGRILRSSYVMLPSGHMAILSARRTTCRRRPTSTPPVLETGRHHDISRQRSSSAAHAPPRITAHLHVGPCRLRHAVDVSFSSGRHLLRRPARA